MILLLSLALLFAVSPVAGQKSDKIATRPSEVRANKKIERQILESENQLKQALTKCDVVSLNSILAEYYADSFEGSDRAISRKGTIARCKDRAVPYYSIYSARRITVRSDIIVIEGISRVSPDDDGTDIKKEPKQMRVKRYWTKKDGRWQLVAQTRLPRDTEPEK